MDFEEIKQRLAGPKYAKFQRRHFSFFALLFGGLYYVYRKMYLEGIIFYFITSLLSSLTFYTGEALFGYATLLFLIIFAVMFGSLYRNYLNKQANLIISTNNTSDTVFKKRGGTNLVAVIIVTILISSLQSVINTKVFEPTFGNTFYKLIKDNPSLFGVNQEELNELNNENNPNSKEEIEEEFKDPESDELANQEPLYKDDWIGSFTNGIYTMRILRKNEDTYRVYLIETMGSSTINAYYDMSVVTNKRLEVLVDYTELISVVLTDNGVKIENSSTISSGLFKKAKGKEFEKLDFSKQNWTGVYTNGDYKIYISELDTGHINVVIDDTIYLIPTDYVEDNLLAIYDHYRDSNKSLHVTYDFSISRENPYEIEFTSHASLGSHIFNKMTGTYTLEGVEKPDDLENDDTIDNTDTNNSTNTIDDNLVNPGTNIDLSTNPSYLAETLKTTLEDNLDTLEYTINNDDTIDKTIETFESEQISDNFSGTYLAADGSGTIEIYREALDSFVVSLSSKHLDVTYNSMTSPFRLIDETTLQTFELEPGTENRIYTTITINNGILEIETDIQDDAILWKRHSDTIFIKQIAEEHHWSGVYQSSSYPNETITLAENFDGTITGTFDTPTGIYTTQFLPDPNGHPYRLFYIDDAGTTGIGLQRYAYGIGVTATCPQDDLINLKIMDMKYFNQIAE